MPVLFEEESRDKNQDTRQGLGILRKLTHRSSLWLCRKGDWESLQRK